MLLWRVGRQNIDVKKKQLVKEESGYLFRPEEAQNIVG